MTTETDWRAVQSLGRMNEPVPSAYRAWSVLNERGTVLATELDEPTARLIAAAPKMQAFLKGEVVDNRHDPFFTTRANEILKKAGATK